MRLQPPRCLEGQSPVVIARIGRPKDLLHPCRLYPFGASFRLTHARSRLNFDFAMR